MAVVNHTERAFRGWQVLTEVARQHGTITYKELAARLGIHHRPVRYLLGPIQDYCMEENLPPLTILVHTQGGRRGVGFIAHDRDDMQGGLEAVWNEDWSLIQNPFDFAAAGLGYDDLIRTLLKTPDESEAVYHLVKSRGIRHLMFKDAVNRAYGGRCAFTGGTYDGALEACHIFPWSVASDLQRLDVRNGILLNPLHHRLFDRGLMTITTAYRIEYAYPSDDESKYSAIERLLTLDLHGKDMCLPRQVRWRPAIENILQHHQHLGWEL